MRRAIFSPTSVAAVGSLSVHSTRVGAASGFRAPTATELGANFTTTSGGNVIFGNPGIAPESNQQIEAGAVIIDINFDEGMLDAEEAMRTFLNLAAAEPAIARVPFMLDSSKWKVIETVREKFSCRDCEKITQPPAPSHVIARGWAGPSLLAMIVFVVVEALLLFTIFRFRAKPNAPLPKQIHGSHLLEMVWTAIPVLILIPLAIWIYTWVFAFGSLWFAHYGLSVLNEMRLTQGPAPVDAPVIDVSTQNSDSLSP